MRRSSVLTTLFSFCLLAPFGCATSTEDVGSQQDDIVSVPKFCGGIAGIPCGADEQCVDDPNDGCDPDKGGADCGGRCVPKDPEPEPKFCGGFAGIPCGPDEECVDNPDDGCDPAKGNADCGGVCAPKAPEPPSCWGAWLDQAGLCRTPADGVYPAECCEEKDEGPTCGDVQCGAGEVCCNPLMGICTQPGEFCAL